MIIHLKKMILWKLLFLGKQSLTNQLPQLLQQIKTTKNNLPFIIVIKVKIQFKLCTKDQEQELLKLAHLKLVWFHTLKLLMENVVINVLKKVTFKQDLLETLMIFLSVLIVTVLRILFSSLLKEYVVVKSTFIWTELDVLDVLINYVPNVIIMYVLLVLAMLKIQFHVHA